MFKSNLIMCRKECPWKEQPDVHLEPLSTEEIANHLLAELITGNGSNSNVLPSTRGVTVQTGTIIRPYKTKKNLEQNQGKPILEKKFKTAKLWICPRCPDVVFEKKRDQLNHIRTIHGVIKRHMCEHCGKSLDVRNLFWFLNYFKVTKFGWYLQLEECSMFRQSKRIQIYSQSSQTPLTDCFTLTKFRGTFIV